MAIFKGSCVALITPFTETGVDYDKLKELIEWHISEGTDSILTCGTTGEATTMTSDEKKEVIKFTIAIVNKRVPIMVGTGSNNTMETIKMSQYAESCGADSILVITPYYNKTNKIGLYKHFEAVNNSVNIPIVLYNVPSRTNMNITTSDLVELSKLSNIKAIKEASGNISQIAEMSAVCGDTIEIYSGNDDQAIPVLSVGGLGVISVAANIIPSTMSKMVHMYLDGDTTGAMKLQLEYLELCNKLFIETNPIPVKTAASLMGKCDSTMRLPLYDLDPKAKDVLVDCMKKYKLI
ncbi:MAG: 4-hydroxy-tetrahydrodipicolinate synthase [Clostridium sp.]